MSSIPDEDYVQANKHRTFCRQNSGDVNGSGSLSVIEDQVVPAGEEQALELEEMCKENCDLQHLQNQSATDATGDSDRSENEDCISLNPSEDEIEELHSAVETQCKNECHSKLNTECNQDSGVTIKPRIENKNQNHSASTPGTTTKKRKPNIHPDKTRRVQKKKDQDDQLYTRQMFVLPSTSNSTDEHKMPTEGNGIYSRRLYIFPSTSSVANKEPSENSGATIRSQQMHIGPPLSKKCRADDKRPLTSNSAEEVSRHSTVRSTDENEEAFRTSRREDVTNFRTSNGRSEKETSRLSNSSRNSTNNFHTDLRMNQRNRNSYSGNDQMTSNSHSYERCGCYLCWKADREFNQRYREDRANDEKKCVMNRIPGHNSFSPSPNNPAQRRQSAIKTSRPGIRSPNSSTCNCRSSAPGADGRHVNWNPNSMGRVAENNNSENYKRHCQTMQEVDDCVSRPEVAASHCTDFNAVWLDPNAEREVTAPLKQELSTRNKVSKDVTSHQQPLESHYIPRQELQQNAYYLTTGSVLNSNSSICPQNQEVAKSEIFLLPVVNGNQNFPQPLCHVEKVPNSISNPQGCREVVPSQPAWGMNFVAGVGTNNDQNPHEGRKVMAVPFNAHSQEKLSSSAETTLMSGGVGTKEDQRCQQNTNGGSTTSSHLPPRNTEQPMNTVSAPTTVIAPSTTSAPTTVTAPSIASAASTASRSNKFAKPSSKAKKFTLTPHAFRFKPQDQDSHVSPNFQNFQNSGSKARKFTLTPHAFQFKPQDRNSHVSPNFITIPSNKMRCAMQDTKNGGTGSRTTVIKSTHSDGISLANKAATQNTRDSNGTARNFGEPVSSDLRSKENSLAEVFKNDVVDVILRELANTFHSCSPEQQLKSLGVAFRSVVDEISTKMGTSNNSQMAPSVSNAQSGHVREVSHPKESNTNAGLVSAGENTASGVNASATAQQTASDKRKKKIDKRKKARLAKAKRKEAERIKQAEIKKQAELEKQAEKNVSESVDEVEPIGEVEAEEINEVVEMKEVEILEPEIEEAVKVGKDEEIEKNEKINAVGKINESGEVIELKVNASKRSKDSMMTVEALENETEKIAVKRLKTE